MTTTPSTASQAPASISDCQEYRNAKAAYRTAVYGDLAQASADLDSCIDTKLAQAHQEAWVAERAAEVEARDRDEWKARAIAAEAKLEAIRQGVEGLTRYFPGCFDADDLPKEGQFESTMWGYANGEWLKRDEVLAILQPQPQADESGLPG